MEEDERSIEVAFIGAAKVDAVDQAHVTFLYVFEVDQLSDNLKGVWLRELLEDECRLLLILVKHLIHEVAAEDTDDGLGFPVFLEKQVNLLDVHSNNILI